MPPFFFFDGFGFVGWAKQTFCRLQLWILRKATYLLVKVQVNVTLQDKEKSPKMKLRHFYKPKKMSKITNFGASQDKTELHVFLSYLFTV